MMPCNRASLTLARLRSRSRFQQGSWNRLWHLLSQNMIAMAPHSYDEYVNICTRFDCSVEMEVDVLPAKFVFILINCKHLHSRKIQQDMVDTLQTHLNIRFSSLAGLPQLDYPSWVTPPCSWATTNFEALSLVQWLGFAKLQVQLKNSLQPKFIIKFNFITKV